MELLRSSARWRHFICRSSGSGTSQSYVCLHISCRRILVLIVTGLKKPSGSCIFFVSRRIVRFVMDSNTDNSLCATLIRSVVASYRMPRISVILSESSASSASAIMRRRSLLEFQVRKLNPADDIQ